MDDELAEREELATATRSLIRNVRVSEVDVGAMRKARALIDEATSLLGGETHDGPHSQMGFGTMLDAAGFGGPPGDWYPYSPVLGRSSPLAPPVRLEVVDEVIDGVERKVVTGRVTLTEAYAGPPWDLTHGGVIALIFDELLGVAAVVGSTGGYTGRLTVHYRKPTPILEELELRGWVDDVAGRKIVAKGEIRADGVLTAEADGLFILSLGLLSNPDEPQPTPDGP